MSTNFPSSLDSYSTKSSGDTISEAHINDPQDAIEALEAKVGVDTSAVTSSHDYKLATANTWTQGSNVNCLDINKTGAGSGIAVDIDNDGTDDGILITQGGVLASGKSALRIVSSIDQTSGNLLRLDVTNTASSQAGFYLNYDGDNNAIELELDAIGNGKGIRLNNPGTNIAIDIQQTGNGVALNIAASNTSQDVIYLIADSLTAGKALFVYSNSANISGDLANITIEHASATAVALRIKNDGSGVPISISGSGQQAFVSTEHLNTSTATASQAATGWLQPALGGGEYAFFPTTKNTSATTNTTFQIFDGNSGTMWTTYAAKVTMYAGAGTISFINRYVTSSGTDFWSFIKVDKITKDIIATWSAPDHPAYGNGGDFDALPHPFGSYDETKEEIILLDKGTCNSIRQEVEDTGKDIITLLHEEYKIGVIDKPFVPLHSGKKINKGGEVELVMVNTIPNYIKVRDLQKMNNGEKTALKNRMAEKVDVIEIDKQNKRNNFKQKFNVTDDFIDELKELL